MAVNVKKLLVNIGGTDYALIGETGARGATGAAGAKGDTGAKGDKGETGAAGAAATITIGNVTTLAAGSNATVTNRGTANAAVLDFGIPQGAKGDKGETGAAGSGGSGGSVDLSAYSTTAQNDAKYATKTELTGKADTSHTHSEYATKTELNGKADKEHSHDEYALKSELDGLGGGDSGGVPDKWAVLVVAGQSNAVGYDESAPNMIFDVQRDRNRVKQLGYKGEHNLQIVDLGYCAENFQDMSALGYKNQGTKGIHLPLANMLLDYVPKDYGVLVLPCAFGGTAFGSNSTYDAEKMQVPANANQCSWGANANQYRAMKDRLKKVLDMNEQNVLLGVVWVQGEHGASNPQNNNTSFDAMTQQFFTDFANYRTRTRRGVMDKSIWFNVETTFKWYEQDGVNQIWNHYREWNADTYVEVPRDPNLTNGLPNGSANGAPNRNVPDGTAWSGTQTTAQYMTHFGNNAYATVIAPRVLRAMLNNGCLFYSGVHDKDTVQDVATLEQTVENLHDEITLLRQAIADANINIPEAEKWVNITEDQLTKIFTDGAIFDANSATITMNTSGAGVLLPEGITKFRFTDQTENNKIMYLICGVNTVSTDNSAYAEALYLDFSAGVQSGWIKLGGTNNRMSKSAETGKSAAEIQNFFGNGNKYSFEVEYNPSSNDVKFTRISDNQTMTISLNSMTTATKGRFGFATFYGSNYASYSPSIVTNVQIVEQ